MKSDLFWMDQATELSRRGFPAPNPHVGCVIVNGDELVGEGWHEHTGGPHAEVNALSAAGSRARGAVAYVTLEPCHHTGRTGPCSQALLEAGVREVFFATPDPNPVASGGAAALSGMGVKCHHLPAPAANQINRQFLFSQHMRRPFVTVKAAVSLDGRIAMESGESRWITGSASRKDAQRLRAECGSVLVGRKTAEQDRARLTVRDHPVHNPPTRIVIDPKAALAKDLPIFDHEAPTLRFTLNPEHPRDRALTDIPTLLETIFDEGLRGVLIEGGALTISEFFRAGLVDEIVLYAAPIVLGEGPSWSGAYGLDSLQNAEQFSLVETLIFNRDDDIHKDLRMTLQSRNLSNFLAS